MPLNVISGHLNLTDPAGGGDPTSTVGEEELTVNFPDVLDYQLLLGFHPKVLAELAAVVNQIGGQQNEGGEMALLHHPVGLLQVGFDRLVRQEGEIHAGELKYQEIAV